MLHHFRLYKHPLTTILLLFVFGCAVLHSVISTPADPMASTLNTTGLETTFNNNHCEADKSCAQQAGFGLSISFSALVIFIVLFASQLFTSGQLLRFTHYFSRANQRQLSLLNFPRRHSLVELNF